MFESEGYELKCESCVAYSEGECRCSAPVIIGTDLQGKWPKVEASNWCLQFTPSMSSEDFEQDAYQQ